MLRTLLRPTGQLSQLKRPLSVSSCKLIGPIEDSDKPRINRQYETPSSFITGTSDSEAWKARKCANLGWKKRQRIVRRVKDNPVPERFKSFDKEFDEKVMSFEKQLEALRTRGFLRAYKPYDPPHDLDVRFMKVASNVLDIKVTDPKGLDMKKMSLDRSSRAKLLMALYDEFSHIVPNSMVHTMETLDHVFLFYSSAVDVKTPYEKLHHDQRKGRLPKNLHIQLEPKRFDPEGDHPFEKVTAFPRISTIIVSPEARKKYKDVIQEHSPYKNSISEK